MVTVEITSTHNTGAMAYVALEPTFFDTHTIYT